MNALAISAQGLRAVYGRGRRATTVLDGVDLAVREGSVVALLGPNGAGKTTTVNILTTLKAPDAGTATVGGHDLLRDPDGVRSVIGLTGQFAAVDGLMTGEENLRLMADLRHLGADGGRRRVAELVDRFDLGAVARRPLATWSGGMRRRLDLAMTLVGNPRVIFLDEPTTGLDPRSRQTTWDVVREVIDDGVTVLLTTQYLEEADRLADEVVVLDHGRVVGQGSPARLKAQVGTEVLVARTHDGTTLCEIPTDGSPAGMRRALAELESVPRGTDDVVVELRAPSLDDVFLALTKEES